MSDLITIKNLRDTLTPDLQAKADAIANTRPLMGVLGKRLETELREHFRIRNLRPNKRGWPKQNFWDRIRRATALAGYTDRTATVAIADPAIAAHTTPGGFTITAKNPSGLLAIPLKPEAAGIFPSSGLIKGLFRGFSKKTGKSWLAVVETAASGLKILYALKASVTIPYDPDALPSEEKLRGNVADELRDWLRRNANA